MKKRKFFKWQAQDKYNWRKISKLTVLKYDFKSMQLGCGEGAGCTVTLKLRLAN